MPLTKEGTEQSPKAEPVIKKLTLTELGELFKEKSGELSPSDLITIIDPKKPEDQARINEIMVNADSALIEASKSSYRQELAELRPGEKIRDDDFLFVYFKLTDQVAYIPRKEIYEKILYSRLIPLFGHQELERLRDLSSVVIFGASTGDSIATQLCELGVGDVTIIDPDVIAASNLTRVGSGVTDVGKPKVTQTGNNLLSKNPFLDVSMIQKRLNEEEIRALLTKRKETNKSIVVYDAMDDLATKIILRIICKELEIPVIMNTNVGWCPIITVEKTGDPDFVDSNFDSQAILTRLSELRAIKPNNENEKKQISVEMTSIIIKMVGIENLPPRQMLNLVLRSLGLMSYLAQHGANAAGGATLAAKVGINELLGKNAQQKSIVDFEKLGIKDSTSLQKADNRLINELALNDDYGQGINQLFKLYSDQQKTLVEALDDLIKQHFAQFGIPSYTWNY